MSKHKKIYFDHYGLSQGDYVGCEVCKSPAVDVHAIECDGMGGSKKGHVISNLIAVCRECHIKYGDKKQYKEMLNEIVSKRK